MKRLITTSAILGLACTSGALAQSPTHVDAISIDKTPVVYRDFESPQADLYNQMGYIYGSTYNAGNGDNIGGSSIFGVNYNLGVADDVLLDANYQITTVEAGYVNFFGAANTDALVEVFEDAGGKPAEAPVCSACLPGVSTGFTDVVFGLLGNILTVDTSSAACCVGPGTFWFASQPISSDWNYICRNTSEVIGNDSVGRDSGIDHQNQGACAGGGIGGGYGTNDWLSFGSLGYGAGTAAMRVAGNACGGLNLTVTGNCPGQMQVCITGANAGDQCGIVYSFSTGTFNVPGCGPIGGLNSPTIVGTGVANGSGMFCVSGQAPAKACGHVLVQGIDKTQCLATAVQGI